MSSYIELLVARITVKTLPQAIRIVRIVVGFTVLIIGLVLLVTPGPAVVVIPIGLAILAGEFVWAKRILKKFNGGLKQLGKRK
jgi:tellurite resistance protein TerC